LLAADDLCFRLLFGSNLFVHCVQVKSVSGQAEAQGVLAGDVVFAIGDTVLARGMPHQEVGKLVSGEARPFLMMLLPAGSDPENMTDRLLDAASEGLLEEAMGITHEEADELRLHVSFSTTAASELSAVAASPMPSQTPETPATANPPPVDDNTANSVEAVTSTPEMVPAELSATPETTYNLSRPRDPSEQQQSDEDISPPQEDPEDAAPFREMVDFLANAGLQDFAGTFEEFGFRYLHCTHTQQNVPAGYLSQTISRISCLSQQVDRGPFKRRHGLRERSPELLRHV
jgi:hypothetical protein